MGQITEKEYRCAYKEVITIIDSLEENVKELIPKEKIEFYKKHMDEEHNFEIDYNKTIAEQNILYPTKCILANLFKEYIANEEDKRKILEKEKEELIEIEKEKRERYNPDDIFKKQIRTSAKELSKELVVKKEKISIFKKIKNKIIYFFKKL